MLTWHLFSNDQTVLLQTQCLIIELVDKILPMIVYVGLTAHGLWELTIANILNILSRCAQISTGLICNACACPLIMCFDLHSLSGPSLTVFCIGHEIRLESSFYT